MILKVFFQLAVRFTILLIFFRDSPKMVREYIRKTDQINIAPTPEDLLDAVREVVVQGVKVRAVARKYGINHQTLGRYCSKIPEEWKFFLFQYICKN